MKNLSRSALLILLTLFLVLAACSRSAGTGSPQKATPQETGADSEPVISAPVGKTPTEHSEENKKDQKKIAAPVTPPSETSGKDTAKDQRAANSRSGKSTGPA